MYKDKIMIKLNTKVVPWKLLSSGELFEDIAIYVNKFKQLKREK